MYNNFLVTIGLEIHAQLKSQTKLFSPDKAGWTTGENDEIHPISLALPGTLPVLNETALKMALKTALAFKGNIKNKSVFARKNYFYPDLPKGYQISQYNKPFCEGGRVNFFNNESTVSIPLERIHLEEDAGRSLHKGSYTLINFNRAGIALLEIVTKPEIKDPHIASLCAKAIRRTLRYLEVCDGNLEEGSMRCDCNISLRPKGQNHLGQKVELKNINSFRFIEKALFYEINRQTEILKKGEKVQQETRLYDSSKNQTHPMRSKESASDYRYFPDPDLLPIFFEKAFLKNLKLPELPFEKSQRFIKDYQLKAETAQTLIENKQSADYFEQIASEIKDPQKLSFWILGEVQAQLNQRNENFCPIPAKDFSSLLKMINKSIISNKMAKEIFNEMWEKGLSPEEIIETKNIKQISGEKELRTLIIQILKKHPQQVKAYKSGKNKLFGFFVGQAMKESKGQANPQKLSQLLTEELEKYESGWN
ncbi:MAG: Asp-tRNA(Asn)/Glu-tRNA(Gln) amidotransferase subunit GatB [Bdellovibrionaceae bacterium]|nr:Asp-tRNA(Asn)/Glu-tRNA(Gln) amidotransferase subunit GatB [Pseudobdellovibrionaceae bacterium]